MIPLCCCMRAWWASCASGLSSHRDGKSQLLCQAMELMPSLLDYMHQVSACSTPRTKHSQVHSSKWAAH